MLGLLVFKIYDNVVIFSVVYLKRKGCDMAAMVLGFLRNISSTSCLYLSMSFQFLILPFRE